jgi:hypothetical protein
VRYECQPKKATVALTYFYCPTNDILKQPLFSVCVQTGSFYHAHNLF